MNRDYIDIASEWFANHLESLLKEHEGEWAVVKDELIGVYPSYEDAYRQGVLCTGSEEFLVRRILDQRSIQTAEISVNLTLGLLGGRSTIS